MPPLNVLATRALGKLRKFHDTARAALDERALDRPGAQEHTRLERFLHFWALVGRSFSRNKCPIRASSLAYASLLAIVPMLAVVIGISSSLLKKQGEEPIQQFVSKLVESVTPNEEADALGLRRLAPANVATETPPSSEEKAKAQLVESTRNEITSRIMEFVENTQSTAMSATGVVALLVVAILMLARIEETLNDIWGVTKGRSWFTRVIQYWAAISLGPVLMISAIAITSGQYLKKVQEFLDAFGPLGEWAVGLGIGSIPYVILSVTFGCLYKLVPNTRVEWRAAAVGGVVAGVLWQLNQEFSVFYVSRVVSNSRIYGSLGAIPVFMIGLYISWIIVLFGAQVAYAYQNRRSYAEEKQVESVNQRSREFLALRLLTFLAQRFQRGEKPPNLAELSDSVGVPSRLANQVLMSLEQAGLILETAGGECAYFPARPLEAITADDVLRAMRVGSGRELATRADESRDRIRAEFERIDAAERSAAGGLTLQELARSPSAPPRP